MWQKTWRDIFIVLAAAWAARLFFILIIPVGARSFDAFAWQDVAKYLEEGINPYHATVFLSWPPFWMQLIFCLSKTSAFLGIPFLLTLQIFLVLIESIVIVQVFKLIQEVAPGANARNILLFGISLNPVAILLVCQHCNFDVLVGLWVVLFARSLVKFNRTSDIGQWLLACIFVGLGILTKTVPLILVPMLAGGFHRASPVMKFIGAFLAFAPTVLGMSVIYVLTPNDITSHVLGYRALPSYFGIGGLFEFFGADRFLFIDHFAFYGLVVICLVVTWILFWHRQVEEKEIILLPALILLGVPTFGTGWAPQYAYWFIPLFVVAYALYNNQWRCLLVSAGLVTAATYVVEYALLPGLGGFALWCFIDPAKLSGTGQLFITSPAMQNILQHVETAGGQILITLPMFIADVVLIIFGFRILNLKRFLHVTR